MERSARRWGSSWVQPLTGMSAGVSGFRANGHASRGWEWSVGSDGDHWEGLNLSPDGTRTTGTPPRGWIDRIKASTPEGTTEGGGGCIDQSID